MVIPEGAKNPEGAWEFLQYIAGEEGQRIYSKDTSHLPTFESLGSEEGLLDERHAFFATLLPQAKSRPPLPVGALYWDELTTAWQATYLNQAPAGGALASAAERTQQQLDQFCLAEPGCQSFETDRQPERPGALIAPGRSRSPSTPGSGWLLETPSGRSAGSGSARPTVTT